MNIPASDSDPSPAPMVVTSALMRACEDEMFSWGLPQAALMEKAGLSMHAALARLYPASTHGSVLVAVGPGHNGADGLVVARELALEGRAVSVWLEHPEASLKELTRAHLTVAKKCGVRLIPTLGDTRGREPRWTLIVDALYGFGVTRTLSRETCSAIEALNAWPCPRVALDLPSGLHADRGMPMGACVRADHTLCLGLYKEGLFANTALAYTGEIHLIDLGFRAGMLSAVRGATDVPRAVFPEELRGLLPSRRDSALNKYTAGLVGVCAGSPAYAGAAVLAVLGAMASGAGYVRAFVPSEDTLIVQLHAPSAVCKPQHAYDELLSCRAAALGPGMSPDAARSALARILTPDLSIPLVLDAEALNALANAPRSCHAQAPVVLTPHEGEFARLCPELGANLKEGQISRLNAARSAARRFEAYVVLKGPRTVIASPQGDVRVLTRSTPALARAGTGDVLTGLLAGLLSQNSHNENLLRTLCAGVLWHAEAGRWLAQRTSDRGVDALRLAQGLAEALPSITNESSG